MATDTKAKMRQRPESDLNWWFDTQQLNLVQEKMFQKSFLLHQVAVHLPVVPEQ